MVTASSGNLTWSNAEITAAMSGNGHSFGNLKNKYFWFVFDLDTYNQKEVKERGRQILPNSYIDIDATTSFNIYGSIDITDVVALFL